MTLRLDGGATRTFKNIFFINTIFCIPATHNCRGMTLEQAQSIAVLYRRSREPSMPREHARLRRQASRSPNHSKKLANKESAMKLAILGVLLTTLIAATPIAFAQQSSGRASDQQMQDKSSKKSAHARKHEGKTMGAKPATPDSDNTSVPGASFDKDDTPKSR